MSFSRTNLHEYILGQYCESSGSSSTSDCKEGYYCTQNATSDSPTDGVTGNICPPGNMIQTMSDSMRIATDNQTRV